MTETILADLLVIEFFTRLLAFIRPDSCKNSLDIIPILNCVFFGKIPKPPTYALPAEILINGGRYDIDIIHHFRTATLHDITLHLPVTQLALGQQIRSLRAYGQQIEITYGMIS